MTQITILTAGSRGDVQPYVGLGKGLQSLGYKVRILATNDFEALVTGSGLDYISTGPNAQAILQSEEWQELFESGNFIAIQKKMREEAGKFAPIIAQSTTEGCEDSDLLIGGIGALMGGFSIAEKMNIPIINAHVFPTTPTQEFSSPILPDLPFGNLLNRLSMIITDQILWQSLRISDVEVRKQLNMPKAPFWGPFKWIKDKHVPTIYGFSSYVIPKPADWDVYHHVVGYWFLDPEKNWCPPPELIKFLDEGEPPVYIGFGSMQNKDAEQATQIALEALTKTGQRGVLASGWGGMTESDVPNNIHMLSSIPHSWLFPQMKAIVHHGGAGTTAAGLRAGIPTLIIPFFGDQSFWGKRIHKLGVGVQPIPRKELTQSNLASAIQQVSTNSTIQKHATKLGQRIQNEDSITPVAQIIDRLLSH